MINKILIRKSLVFCSIGFLFACSSNSVVFNKSFKPDKVVPSNSNPQLELDVQEKKSISKSKNSQFQVDNDKSLSKLDRNDELNTVFEFSEKKSKVGRVIKELWSLAAPNSPLLAKGMEENSALKFQDEKKTPGISIAGFVLGVVSLLLLPVVTGALGIIFSAIGLGKDSSQYKNGLAIAGLICGIIGFTVGLAFLAGLL